MPLSPWPGLAVVPAFMDPCGADGLRPQVSASSVARLSQPRLSLTGGLGGRYLRPARERGAWSSGPQSAEHLLVSPTVYGVTGKSPSRPFLSFCASRLPVDPWNGPRVRGERPFQSPDGIRTHIDPVTVLRLLRAFRYRGKCSSRTRSVDRGSLDSVRYQPHPVLFQPGPRRSVRRAGIEPANPEGESGYNLPGLALARTTHGPACRM